MVAAAVELGNHDRGAARSGECAQSVVSAANANELRPFLTRDSDGRAANDLVKKDRA